LDLKSVIDTRRTEEPDLLLFITVFSLAGIGIAMSYSASAAYAANTFKDSFYFLKRQILWAIIGFGMLLFFLRVDYRTYIRKTKVLLLLSFIALILVLIPGIGKGSKGAVRWINFGFIGFQPSEFVKICIVIYLAKVFSSDNQGAVNHMLQLLIPVLITGITFMLIMLQPNFGTAMDILIVSALILFVSGFPIMYIFTLIILSIPMFYLLIYQVEYRKDRLLSYFNPWSDRYGIGYHIIQSFIAFKMGGMLGSGLGHGTQKLSRLPEPHTDFIFAVIAEETGLLGTIFIVGLFCIVFWRGTIIALGAPDEFGRLLGMGLTLLIVVQAFINIGVVSGSLPTTGVPLPFLSYGGSSLLSSMICVGILLNISRYREVVYEGVKISDEVWR
jgi:cell division protein FtsW